MVLKKIYTVRCKTESSFHSDEMINIKPPRPSSLTTTSVFTLLLQSGFSTVMLLTCLCKSCVCANILLLPSLWPIEAALFQAFILFTVLSVSHTCHLSPPFLQEKNLDWFPRMRAMSLVSSEGDNEQNEMRSLQEKMENTANLVAQLSGQLAELKEQVECYFRHFSCSCGKGLLWALCYL